MSGPAVQRLVEKRLEIAYHVKVVLTVDEEKELNRELGETDCPVVCARLNAMSDEELYELIMMIIDRCKKRKKKGDDALAQEIECLQGVVDAKPFSYFGA